MHAKGSAGKQPHVLYLTAGQVSKEGIRRTFDEGKHCTSTGTIGEVFSRQNTSNLAYHQDVAGERYRCPAYHLRSHLGFQRLVQVASSVSKQHCADRHRSKGWSTRANPDLDFLLGSYCEYKSFVVRPHLSDDRDRS